MNGQAEISRPNSSGIGIVIIFGLFFALFIYVIAHVDFSARSDEQSFALNTFARVDIRATYDPPRLPLRKLYATTIEDPQQVARLVDAAKRSRLGHWGRRRCHLSADSITLIFTSPSGDSYTALARRCSACGTRGVCGRDPAFKDDDIDDPLLVQLVALGFPLTQDIEPLY